ncbi:MAG: leucine-rich repeat protein [Candidatus Faecivicinus sp.]
MKKWIVAILILSLALVLTGCSCKHEVQNLLNAVDATCTGDGYTGDMVCEKCGETVTKGEVIPAAGHAAGERLSVVEATCVNEGYTGDVYCTVCGELIEQGETIPMTEHTPEEERYRVYEPTCTDEGSTGVLVCSYCNAVLEEAEVIPALGHTLGDPEGVVEATCLKAGYTGDQTCTVCGQIIRGEVVDKLEHDYVDNVCTICGWRVPGLYLNGNLEFDWDELVASNYVQLKEKDEKYSLISVVPSLYGELIVGENIISVSNNCFEDSLLTAIWLPSSLQSLGGEVFQNATELKEVRFFGSLAKLGLDRTFIGCTSLETVVWPDSLKEIAYRSFEGCTSLKEIEIPEGVTAISDHLFSGCTSLKSVTIPSSVTIIKEGAFENCTSLKEIVIPEGVATVEFRILNGSGVTELTLPSTVTELEQQSGNEALKRVDLSRTGITAFTHGATFADCTSLEEIALPEGLESFSRNDFDGCPQLKALVLPDSVRNIESWGWGNEMSTNEALTTIVWPVSLTDGTLLSVLPNVQQIYYRGSEMKWSLTVSKDMFPNAEIIYDYTGE